MKKKGFTLIEIMIVLLVFSIGVMAVLKLILYNMSAMNDLKNRSTAIILAKEGLELAYNTRDSNRIASLPRDCITNQSFDGNTNDQICKNNFLDNNGKRTIYTSGNIIKRNQISEFGSNNNQPGKLYIQDNNGSILYSHKITEQPSVFQRYISFTGVINNNEIINTGYLLKIESHVIYQKGSRTGKVALEGFIGNY